MEIDEISLDLIVAEIFDRWPETIPVFIRRRMDCVGCPMAKFMTVRDAVAIYELPADEFLKELRGAVRVKEKEDEM